MRLGDVGEERRTHEVAARGQLAGRLVHLGALGHACLDELLDLRELGRVVDGADIGVLVERIPDPQRREAILEPLDEGVRDRLLDEQAAAGAAHLALVEEDPVDHALDGLVERRVIEDDVGSLAAELERQALVRSRERAADRLADRGRAGEGDLVHVGVLDQRETDLHLAR